MITLDKIRLTGLLRRKPWKRGFLYWARFVGDSTRFRLRQANARSPWNRSARAPGRSPVGLCRQRSEPHRNDGSTGGRQAPLAGPAPAAATRPRRGLYQSGVSASIVALNEAQVAVLRWIAAGSPSGVMEGYTHRVSASALRTRDLVRISGRGPTWRAELTERGREQLELLEGEQSASSTNGKIGRASCRER